MIEDWYDYFGDSDLVSDGVVDNLMGGIVPLIFVRNIVVSIIENAKNLYSIF